MKKQAEMLKDVSGNILDIDALQDINISAKEEERWNLRSNIGLLTKERDDIVIPYPSVGPYDTANTYEEIEDLQYKKGRNKYYWDKINEINRYLTCGSLYSGHLSCNNGKEYYFIDGFLQSRELKNSSILASVNDAKYNEAFKKWKFPKRGGRNFFLEEYRYSQQ